MISRSSSAPASLFGLPSARGASVLAWATPVLSTDGDVLAVEPAACPSLTRGRYAYDFGDTGRTEAFYREVLGLEVVNMGDDGSGNDAGDGAGSGGSGR